MKPNIFVITSLFILSSIGLKAQGAAHDFFTNTGKINTVLAVVVILFLVLIGFLIYLERRMNKLEKRINNE